MKKAVLFILLFCFGFSNLKAATTIAGKIANSPDAKILIFGENFELEISLSPEGNFSKSLDIQYDGLYTLLTSKNRTTLFLSKKTNLKIDFDENDYDKTLRFLGDGSIENQYIAYKNSFRYELKPEILYKLDEAAFLSKIAEIKGKINSKFNELKFSEGEYKTQEIQNLHYFEQANFLNYPLYHAHYTSNPNFKTTESFPKFDETIDLDNDMAFLFSNPYKQIVNAIFNKKIASQMSEKNKYASSIALPEIEILKSEHIKNFFCKNLMGELTASNPELEHLYAKLLTLSTDNKFKKELAIKYNNLKSIEIGKPSPSFSYENHNGATTTLESLKGKYVYIDVWATWCGPCRAEIPSLQKVEEAFAAKNIAFVSISVDEKKDHDKWFKLVDSQKMGGIQLFADNNWTSTFVRAYSIDSIPRFILIDPNGNIVDPDAPRPSDPELTKILNGLGL